MLAQKLRGRYLKEERAAILNVKSNTAPLSFSQERLWFLQALHPESPAYNMPLVLHVIGKLDHVALISAAKALCARHRILNTLYASDRIQTSNTTTDLVVDVRHGTRTEVEGWLEDASKKPFDLSNEISFRLHIYYLNKQGSLESRVMINMHHIACDGFSLPILFRDLSEFYNAEVKQKEAQLPMLPIQYADYARWQKNYQAEGRFDEDMEFWTSILDGIPKVHALPLDHNRPLQASFKGNILTFLAASETLVGLEQLAKKHHCSLFVMLQTAFSILLGRWSRENDIIIGTPIAGRIKPELENLVGFFVNTLPLRTSLDLNSTFEQQLLKNKEVVLNAFQHQAVPFDYLVEKVNPERTNAFQPIVQIMLTLQYEGELALALDGLEVALEASQNNTSKFDLSLAATVQPGVSLDISLEYATDLFAASSIQRLGRSYLSLLSQIVSDPSVAVGRLPIWDDYSEQARYSYQGGLSAIASVHPDIDRGVWDLFSEVSERCASQLAYQDGQSQVSYQELRERSLRKALELQRQGVCVGDRVGIGLSRSGLFVEWMLATVALGGVYVPLDPSYPADRLQLLLGDSSPKVVVCDERWSVASGLRELRAEVEGEEGVGSVSLGDVSGEGFLYMMYTSGTTGVPKGVEVTHRGVIRLVRSPNYVSLGKETVMGYGSNVSFDASTFELWGSLLNGGKLVLIDQGTLLDGAALQAQLLRDKITTMFMTTALLEQIATVSVGSLASLDTLLFGGEAYNIAALRKLWTGGKPGRLVHVYGPTENTTFSTSCEVEQRHIDEGVVPIGRPIAQSGVWVLDEHQRPLAPGALGELVVTGLGLARGYWGRAELTQEKFIELFNGERGYRTGDLVRWSTGGELLFEGRLDDQVKLRGFRVELGEVASVLQGQAGVSQAVVVMDDRLGDRHLVGYVVMEGEVEPGFGVELQDRLRGELPSYMVPSIIECVAALPLTANGKVDKAKLPLPRFLDTQQYEPPRTELERLICEIWEDVLNQKNIGINDNYFRRGGDSIKSVSIAAKMRENNLVCSIKDLFTWQTVKALASHIDSRSGKQIEQNKLPKNYIRSAVGIVDMRDSFLKKCLSLEDSDEIFPVTPTQKHWLLHTYNNPGDEAWWIETVFRVEGEIAERAQEEGLFRAWKKIAMKVPTLRTGFHLENNRLYQIVRSHPNISFVERDVANLDEIMQYLSDRMSDIINIEQEALTRIFSFSTDNNQYFHAVLIHHALVDGWNFSKLLEQVYACLSSDHHQVTIDTRSGLPFVAWQLSQPQNNALRFWQDELKELNDTTPLCLSSSGYVPRRRADVYQPEFELDLHSSCLLYAKAEALSVTPYIFIEGAWARTLGKLTDHQQVFFSTLDSGRNASIHDINSLSFNTLTAVPVKVQLDETQSATEFVHQLHLRKIERITYAYADVTSCASFYYKKGYSSLLIYENLPQLEEPARLHTEKSATIEVLDKYDPCPYKISVVFYPKEQLVGFFEFFRTEFTVADFEIIQRAFVSELKLLVDEVKC